MKHRPVLDRRRLRVFAVSLFCSLHSASVLPTHSQVLLPGDLDSSFADSSQIDGRIRAFAVQKDGRLLIGGEFTNVHGQPRHRIARLLPNGKLDPTFNPGTGANDTVFVITLQPDGRILIGGNFTSYNGVERRRIARLLPDGAIDPSFAPPFNGAGNDVRAILVAPDGGIFIGGDFTQYGGVASQRVAKLHANGNRDPSFNASLGANGAVHALALDSEGRLLIGGGFTEYATTSRPHLARLTPTGALDATYDPPDFDNTVRCLTQRPDGKLLVAGDFTDYEGTPMDRLAQLLPDGTRDPAFDTTGGSTNGGPNGSVHALLLLKDGRAIVAGSFSGFIPADAGGTARGGIARIDASGKLEKGFGGLPSGSSFSSAILYALAGLPGGKIAVGGDFDDYGGKTSAAAGAGGRLIKPRSNLAFLNAKGALLGDAQAVPDLKTELDGLSKITPLADGSALVLREFVYPSVFEGAHSGSSGDGTRVLKLDQQGRLQPSSGFGRSNDDVFDILPLPDGKVMVAGGFTQYRGRGESSPATRHGIARLLPDSRVDPAFDLNAVLPAGSEVHAIATRPNGRLLLAGDFAASVAPITRHDLIEVTASGELVAGANNGVGGNASISHLALTPDGRCYLAGSFTTFNGDDHKNLARLKPNGTLDDDFQVEGTGFDSAPLAIAAQADGKLLVAGHFTEYNGTPVRTLARLNLDGSLDTRFNANFTSGTDTVSGYDLQALPDGKILVVHMYQEIGDQPVPWYGILRLRSDGSLDDSFAPQSYGTDHTASHVSLQKDGKALICGAFLTYDSMPRLGFARLHLNPQFAKQTFTGISQGSSGNASLLGAISIALNNTGAYTAKLAAGKETLAFKGQFDRETRSLAQAKRKDGSLVHLSLALARGPSRTVRIEGQVSDYLGHSAAFIAQAAFHSAKQRPANHYTGRYNVALASEDYEYTGGTQPSGCSFLSFVVPASGKVKVAGKASDGSPLTASAHLSAGGELQLHFPLYQKTGFISGVLTIDATEVDDWDNPRPISANLRWLRPAVTPATGKQPFEAGFEQALVEARGGLYVPPAKEDSPLGGALRATVAGGHVASEQRAFLDFDLKGKAIRIEPDDPGGITDLKLKLNRKTGLLSGSCRPGGPGTKVEKIQAIVSQQGIAFGFTASGSGATRYPSFFFVGNAP